MAEIDKFIVSFFVDEVIGGFFINVPPGHIACIHDLGRGVLKKTWGPGLHLKIPFWQRVKLFNAQILEYTIRHGFDLNQSEALGDEPINTVTADNVLIKIEGSLLARINPKMAPDLWNNIGEGFVSKFVRPVSRSRIRSVISEVTLEQISRFRPQVEQKIKDELDHIFLDKGIIIEGVLLSEIRKINPTDAEPITPVIAKTTTPVPIVKTE